MPSCSADRELLPSSGTSGAAPLLVPLSWLAQYGYCPRRCGLLALDQAWVENAETASGRTQHQRVHTARVERKGDDLFLYELPVYSRTLGVSGKCDCVEAHAAPDGVLLPYGEGIFQLYPVEYKHGVVRKGEEEYHLQLCAQALCLEEQFGCVIPAGSIFYINSHRRDEVALTDALRQKTVLTAWQKRKQEKIQHPFLEETIPIGLIPHTQAMLFARVLRGELDEYPPFHWR
ncbi:MAG: CRISPR-associated protein Cas4 [Clostridiales bacterium]|nr:CRISPR-associated protein Cas4 [Clostridiales bacterium]